MDERYKEALRRLNEASDLLVEILDEADGYLSFYLEDRIKQFIADFPALREDHKKGRNL